jgi:ribosomal protein L15
LTDARAEELQVDCSKLDSLACLHEKQKIGNQLNAKSALAFKTEIKLCRPFEMKTYFNGRVTKITKIVGKSGENCRLEMASSDLPVRQVCLLNSQAIAIMEKDPATYTPEEQMKGTLFFQQQCKDEILGDSKAAKDLREAQQATAKALEDFNAELQKQQTNVKASPAPSK